MYLKFLLSALFLLAGIAFASAQNHPITMGAKKNTFYQNGAPLPMSHFKDRISSSEEALQYFRRAKTNEVFAGIFAFAGGFMIGWPIGTLIGGGEPNWYLALGGAGLIGASIPLIKGYNKQMRKAVEAYNNSLDTDLPMKRDYAVSFCTTSAGAGLMLTF